MSTHSLSLSVYRSSTPGLDYVTSLATGCLSKAVEQGGSQRAPRRCREQASSTRRAFSLSCVTAMDTDRTRALVGRILAVLNRLRERKPPSLVTRAAVIAGSLGAIFLVLAALAHTGYAVALWYTTLLAMALFYAAAHLAPSLLFRLQSMPYTYQLANNVGARGFELQNVTYAAYHTHWYNHATHAAFPVESWLWFAVAADAAGSVGAAALAVGLGAQAFSFGEPRFAIGLCVVWAVVAATSAAAVGFFGAPLISFVQIALMAFGFWRFTGHMVEPMPPGIFGNRRFLPYDKVPLDVRLVWPMMLGYLSEFSAGLPFRLVNSWLFIMAQRAGYQVERRGGLRVADFPRLAQRLHSEGWGAHPTTAAMLHAARTLVD
jgi:hypothetical protein